MATVATTTGKAQCVTCGKAKLTYKCEGCSEHFCFDHLGDHRQTLAKQLDEVENERNLFLQTLTEQKNDPQKHSLIRQINEWEYESITKIQHTAKEERELLVAPITKHINKLEIELISLTEQLKQIRQENDVTENILNEFKQKLKELNEELAKLPNISIQQDSSSFVPKISVIIPVPLCINVTDIPPNAEWNKNGHTVSGENPTLSAPHGLFADDDQTIYVADYLNHRIVAWKEDEMNGQVVAGGHGKGNGAHQLTYPTDVIVDKETDDLIICDHGNNRVVQWPRRNGTSGETIISNIACYGLTMDEHGSLYVLDDQKDEVRRYRRGESQGTIVAGGNGRGSCLNQLNSSTYIFVDRDHTVFVSDAGNHRVMKWIVGAKEGIIVAGGQGQGTSLSQLSCPNGVLVDQLGTVYVADWGNHRVVRWPKGKQQGNIIVGGNGKGAQANQLYWPRGLSFDRHGHLYIVDNNNNRVQRFNIEMPSN